MKIYIDQIPESGLELTESCDPSILDLNRGDIRLTDSLRVFAQISKGINNLSVSLKVDTTMHLNCSRCLEEFTTPLSKKTKLNFPIENKKTIDLADNLREEIMLEYPLKPLCSSDCLGLCPSCGKNLNKGKCNCKPRRENGFTKKTSFKDKTR